MHTIELNNGYRLAYRDHGKGPAMVLVHGWGVSGELFNDLTRALANRYRLLVPDLPGHGASSAFPEQGRFALLADAVAELIRKLQLNAVCLLGWSLGAMVAWDLLQRHRDLDVGALVTVDMVPRLLNNEGWSFGLRAGHDHHAFDRELDLIATDWPAYVELLAPRLINSARPANPELLDKIRAAALPNQPDGMARIWKLMVEQDFRSALQHIDLPSLVIAGEQSALYGVPAGAWVAAQMPHARLEVMADAGHAPHLDQPQRFTELLTQFLTTTMTQTAE